MNKALRRLSLVCLAMFIALLLNVNYLQAFSASSLAADPGNSRVFFQQFRSQRGPIIAAGPNLGQNVTIADSRLLKGSDLYQRHYLNGPAFAAVTGYDSIFGKTGIEGAEDRLLAGTAPSLAVHNLLALLTGRSRVGATVYLTINAAVQAAAYQALAATGRPSAVVAIDPRTGAIIAMASYPSFNPNDYTTLDSGKLGRVDLRYRKDRTQPLLNRAINATYPPGSSFKIVTSSTAFSTGKVAGPSATIPAPQFYHLPGSSRVLTNDFNSPCGNGRPTILFAFTVSCNTAFGKLGVTVGGAALHTQADKFGFNNPGLTIPLPVSASAYPLQVDPAFTALSAIGQYNDAVTPLQEALLAATVANGGTLMRPYLVGKIVAPDLQQIQQTSPTVLSQVLTPAVASNERQLMVGVTQDSAGTAYQTAGPPATSIIIAGKTGTAQNGPNNSGLDDAVFTCFAPAGPGQTPAIAVGVIVQGGGFGAAAAAPIAVQVIQKFLGKH
jgi:peptidoglycan glycosyltransferase